MTRSPTLPPLRWQEDSAERLGLCLLADAIDYLGVSHIVVVGHYDCGAIRASSSNRHHGAPLENWLTPLRDIQRLHKTELMRFSRSGDDRHRRQVELSVIEQCLGVFKNPSVQVRRMQLPRLLLSVAQLLIAEAFRCFHLALHSRQRRRILSYKNDDFPFTSPRTSSGHQFS
jgi:hypothetical protein